MPFTMSNESIPSPANTPQSPMPRSVSNPPQEVIDSIVLALRGLDYGSVVVTVHHARVVQIERHERFRLPLAPSRGPT